MGRPRASRHRTAATMTSGIADLHPGGGHRRRHSRGSEAGRRRMTSKGGSIRSHCWTLSVLCLRLWRCNASLTMAAGHVWRWRRAALHGERVCADPSAQVASG